RIFYADLIQQGTIIIEEKINQMRTRLSRLKTMQGDVTRAEESFRNSKPSIYSLAARDCWIVPYDGNLLCENAGTVSKKVILEIHQNGFQLGNTYGLLLLRQDNDWKQFLFVDVHITEQSLDMEQYPQIIHIPDGNYLCKAITKSGIEQVWEWSKPIIEKEQIELIIETELFVGEYNFQKPVLEQRCLLK